MISFKFIVFAMALSLYVFILGCQSESGKVEDARMELQTSKEDVVEARTELNQAIRDSTDDFWEFKRQNELRIIQNEKDIAELKLQIANTNRNTKANYEKHIVDLEQKNRSLKENLNEYNEENKENWEDFKVKFSRNMDDLGNSISNFFTTEQKK
ncbi:MAG: hypothetical protein CVV22_04890 [Ignavibacteriae bacterium HGW-Ignavibacteriae-1]|jgi:hypothetical protein|nr:MAG: hypothetical protein CVV22_04890 [Ignavibacteriae bacterium HGW-Ignavibacteriae-1]